MRFPVADTLRRLHQITADATAPLNDRVARTLQLGLDALSLDQAAVTTLSKVPADRDVWTVQFSAWLRGPAHLEVGARHPFADSCCARTADAGQVRSFHSGPPNPAPLGASPAAYLGAPFRIRGHVSGVVGFLGLTARATPFPPDAITLVQLVAQWVGAQLELRENRREQSRREAEYRAIHDAAVDGIVTVDERGEIRSANPALCRAFGWAEAELVGQHMDILMPGEYGDNRASLLANVRHSNASAILGGGREAVGQRRDGGTFPLWVSVSEYMVDNQRMFMGILHDLTALKGAERLQDEFVSTVSHELRTPLASISGSLGLLRGGVGGPLGPMAADLIQMAHKNCERLVRLINDILDLEKIESGRLVPHAQHIDLVPLVSDILEQNTPYAQRLGVTLAMGSTPGQARAFADPDHVHQILGNLLSNASKYSKADDQVQVSISHVVGGYRVAVRDAGTGIPKAFRPRLFQRFSQADATDERRKAGTGLGLSIARGLAEANRGSIGYRTEEGVGTTFWFDLPTLTAPDAVASTDSQPRVLVVEDDPAVGQVISRLLERREYKVQLAPTLAAARQALSEQTFAAMTLDLRLPDGSGLDLLWEVRASPNTAGLPVIIVSAGSESGFEEPSGNAVNVVDWIEKPINTTRLLGSLSAATLGRGERLQILHIEDDPDTVRLVSAALSEQATIVVVRTIEQARVALSTGGFDLVLLDLELPDGPAEELLADIHVPVVVFSARELPAAIVAQVSQAMVKSRSSLDDLVAAIGQHLSPSVRQKDPRSGSH